MSKKIYDICVKTGSYTNRDGETKNRYINVGAVIQGDNGPFMLLERWFNPAGVDTDRDSVLLSLFKPDNKAGQGAPRMAGQSTPTGGSGRETPPGLDGDIPF